MKMSMENSKEEIITETEKKDENESQKSMSDGEIVDDDEGEDVKSSLVNFPLRKLQKNFRIRQSESDENEEEEEETVNFNKRPDKKFNDSKKINARNGDEYLQNERKRIINELNEKDDVKKSERHFKDRRDKEEKSQHNYKRSNNHHHYHHRNNDYFRPSSPVQQHHNDSYRRNNSNSKNSFNDLRRENGKGPTKSDIFEVRSRHRLLYFPRNIIKYTTTSPSISYSENPKLNDLKRRNEDCKIKGKLRKEKGRTRSRIRSTNSKEKKMKSSDISNVKNEDQLPKEKEDLNVNIRKVILDEQKAIKHDEDLSSQESKANIEDPSELVCEAIETTPNSPKQEIDKNENEPEEEKIKFEPIIIERRKPKKIDRPKVNIFLEDSDEVDEFENANMITTLEVKSKWSSPESVKQTSNDSDDIYDEKLKKIVPKTIECKNSNSEIPIVVETPEHSPILPVQLTENIFESSSRSLDKSPLLLLSQSKSVKNVCSFLSDIESEGYLSGFSLGDMYDDDDETKTSSTLDKNMFMKDTEPDTTAIESLNLKKDDVCDNDSDSDSDDDSENSSSSESSSDSSSESEEESSDDTSDEETTAVVNRFAIGGFGRFDATSVPMVTQIKPIVTQTIAGTTETTTTSRFQPHQSIIRPPELVTNLTKPPLYTPSQIIPQVIPQTSGQMPFISSPFGQAQFPIPFKIYSLRDAGNSGIIFPSISSPLPITPVYSLGEKNKDKEKEKEKEKEREKDKRPEKREREKHRSHSREKERERKKFKEDKRDSERRRTTPRRRSLSPKRRSITPKRRSPSPLKKKHLEDKRDLKRRDSPKHNSKSSHSSRRSRRSRSRSLTKSSTISRPRTPPPKIRRLSRSPISKHRRSSSPSSYNQHHHHHHHHRSPSPSYKRSPRRRYSPSLKDQKRSQYHTTSPDYGRYDRRRSFSPSYGNKVDSPSTGYKPDSTISDTELERQQFASQNDFYISNSWNSSCMNLSSNSPRRQNLDDRIHHIFSESSTPASASQLQLYSTDGSYPYSQIHDNHHINQIHHHNQHSDSYYLDPYSQSQSSFIPSPHSSSIQIQPIDTRFSSSNVMNHESIYEDGFNTFSSHKNYVNNSNLVEITQQKRERQRIGSNQVAVQVGNVLEIVPNSKIPTPPLPSQEMSSIKTKALSPEEIKHMSEKREESKAKRKAERERKRTAKHLRKERLRQEIQKYFDAGISIEDSDDETLIKLRPVNVNAIADRGIIKRSKLEEKVESMQKEKKIKYVLFSDGILPGETSSEEDIDENESTKRTRLKRKRLRKKRMNQIIRERKKSVSNNELEIIIQKQDEFQILVSAPPGSPPSHLKQPRLKNITPDMFAAFSINAEPMYYHLHKLQAIQQENTANAHYRNDRYRHHQTLSSTMQRYCIPSTKPLNSMDPRINHHRAVEKTFA